ncbi:hypothetical protein, partial [Trinickia sp.]|uniref:hypothetical protein n=1 Tax=Trinickia sp. TaxID=2571163 RepID=UPI003F81841C
MLFAYNRTLRSAAEYERAHGPIKLSNYCRCTRQGPETIRYPISIDHIHFISSFFSGFSAMSPRKEGDRSRG